MKSLLYFSILMFSLAFIQAQTFKTKFLNDEEIKEVFLTERNPEEQRAFYESIRNKTYNFVLEYRGEILFMDALAKYGGKNISFGRSTTFCIKESDLDEKDLQLLAKKQNLRLKYDVSNQDFLCSSSFNIFEKKNQFGEKNLRHVLYPVLVTKILEVSLSDGEEETEPTEKVEESIPVEEGIKWPTKD